MGNKSRGDFLWVCFQNLLYELFGGLLLQGGFRGQSVSVSNPCFNNNRSWTTTFQDDDNHQLPKQ